MFNYQGDTAIHSVSPALSTHVPDAPAVTPATYMSPVKSAPALRDYQGLSQDPTHTTISLSQKAQPPSRELREMTLMSSMPSNVSQKGQPPLSPLETKIVGTPEDQGKKCDGLLLEESASLLIRI